MRVHNPIRTQDTAHSTWIGQLEDACGTSAACPHTLRQARHEWHAQANALLHLAPSST